MEPGRDAWELLQRVWMLKGPHTIALPVDPVAIGQDLEIEVLDDDELAPEISSVLRTSGSVAPQILLNPVDGFDRRRFPCALALGHYSRCLELGLDEPREFVERRDFLSTTDLDDGEAYAIEFASELLVPRIALREVLDTRGVAALAAYFGVTGDVMSFRLGRVGMANR
jgi:IrrE N-terminal-like domain